MYIDSLSLILGGDIFTSMVYIYALEKTIVTTAFTNVLIELCS